MGAPDSFDDLQGEVAALIESVEILDAVITSGWAIAAPAGNSNGADYQIPEFDKVGL